MSEDSESSTLSRITAEGLREFRLMMNIDDRKNESVSEAVNYMVRACRAFPDLKPEEVVEALCRRVKEGLKEPIETNPD